MSDNQALESYDKGSITAEKMRAAAEKIDLPEQNGRLLSPHRHDPAD